MTRLAGWIAALWALTSGAAGQIEVSFDLPPEGVSFGEPFVITVSRSWIFGVAPEPFDEKALSPLSVQLEAAERATSGSLLDWERLRFRARAYVVGEVRIPTIEFRHRGHVASCTPAPFVVRSILPEPPGDIEWPGDVREWPHGGSWRWWLLALLVAVAGGLWWWRRPGATATAPASVVAAPPAHELTLAQLAALGLPEQEAAVEAWYTELAEILRGHTERRFLVPAAVRTSQEIVAAVPLGQAPLQRCLLACDLVKFAAFRPARPKHADALQQAEAFVKASAGDAP